MKIAAGIALLAGSRSRLPCRRHYFPAAETKAGGFDLFAPRSAHFCSPAATLPERPFGTGTTMPTIPVLIPPVTPVVKPQKLYSNAAEIVCAPADISHSMRSTFALQQT